jgi:hypothetical protein
MLKQFLRIGRLRCPIKILRWCIFACGYFWASKLEAGGGIEPPIAELQSAAVPLCYPATVKGKPAYTALTALSTTTFLWINRVNIAMQNKKYGNTTRSPSGRNTHYVIRTDGA